MDDESKNLLFLDGEKNDLSNNFSINNVKKTDKECTEFENRILKMSPIQKKYFYYSIKIFLLISVFLVFIYKVQVVEIDLSNYIDKIYGEEDLLTIRKEKEEEKEMFKERREEIEKEIRNINNTIEQIKQKKKEIINNNKKIIREDGKLILACAYALNNGFTYPTLVAMTSLVINAGNNIFYNIYVLISPDFTEENKQVLMTVEKKYNEHCKIFFINMGDKFQGLDTNVKIPTAGYYRLDLHNLLPDVDRILYMDGDTAVFQDLSELITLDMKGNYILGFQDSAHSDRLEYYNITNATVLCSGVLLMDLSAMRKNNITEKFNEFFEKYKGNIVQHDQTTINVVCQGKISTLPLKYGMWNYKFFRQFDYHCHIQFPFVTYNKKEIILAYENPGIIHYVMAKPYHRRGNNKYYYKEWWDYAKTTGYYKEVYNYAY